MIIRNNLDSVDPSKIGHILRIFGIVAILVFFYLSIQKLFFTTASLKIALSQSLKEGRLWPNFKVFACLTVFKFNW